MPNNSYFALDTSNYTTSAALFVPQTNTLYETRKLLEVKPGTTGLRQSDALFQHTLQLPALVQELFSKADTTVQAVGVSACPRDVEGSYMPCFLAGVNAASTAAAALGVPLVRASHQTGHVVAALYSAACLAWLRAPFLALHVSGGTTELLHVVPDAKTLLCINRVGGTGDLNAGQVIDRVGVRLGFAFPAGPQMDALSLQSEKALPAKPSVKGLQCSFSGLENQCDRLLQQGELPADVSRFCLDSIGTSLTAIIQKARCELGDLPLVCAGGVMANTRLRHTLQEACDARFASTALSSDNAAGIAVYTALRNTGGQNSYLLNTFNEC